jgi:hypothetical protein
MSFLPWESSPESALIIIGDISTRTELWVMLTAVLAKVRRINDGYNLRFGEFPDEYCDPAGSL